MRRLWRQDPWTLTWSGNRIQWMRGGGPPRWLCRRGVCWRSPREPAHWSRVGDDGRWWAGRLGRDFIVVGFGVRPRLIISQGRWVGMMGGGVGPAHFRLPADLPVTLRQGRQGRSRPRPGLTARPNS